MKEIECTVKKIGFIILMALLFSTISSAATFTAVASGNWSSTSTWGGTAPAYSVTSDKVVIGSGISVTMDADVTLNGALSEIQIDGTLSGSSGTTLTVTQGIISGAGNISSGTVIFGQTAILTFSGALTADNFENNALILKTSANVKVNQNLTMKSGQISLESGSNLTLNSGSAIIIAGGTLAINGGNLSLSSAYSVSYINTSMVAGLELTGSGLTNVTVDVGSGKNVVLSNDLTVTGILSLKSGTLDLSVKNLVIKGDIAANGSGNITSSTFSNISIVNTSSITGTLTFSGKPNYVNNFTVDIGNGNYVKIKGDLAIKGTLALSSGMLDVSTSSITLNGDIAANNNGVLFATNATSITLNTTGSSSGSLSFATGGNTVHNLTVNTSSNGSVIISSNLTVAGTLTLTNGNINIGSNNLTIANSGSISGGSSGSYIITGIAGYVVMPVMADESSSTTFHIGTASNYFPAAITLNKGSSSGNVKLNVTDNVYAQGSTGAIISANKSVVNATWDVQTDITANLDLAMKLMWAATAEVNSFDRKTAYISHYTNAKWDVSAQAMATLESNGLFSVKRSGLTSLSPFAVFDQNTAGVEQASKDGSFAAINVYPNPASDKLYIDRANTEGVVYADVIASDGRILSTARISDKNTAIDINTLPAGVYYIKLYGNSNSKVNKFVKM